MGEKINCNLKTLNCFREENNKTFDQSWKTTSSLRKTIYNT